MTAVRDLQKDYKRAQDRLFLLDYDGTLADIAPTPPEAAPTPRLLAALEKLSSDPRNTVAVISGRPHQELEDWLGRLPVTLIAEHGIAQREPGGSWQLADVDNTWKAQISGLMQEAIDAVPGTFIDEKHAGLAWHYRTAKNPDQVPAALDKLTQATRLIAKDTGLHLMHGKKNLEVRLEGVHKGVSATELLAKQPWDFVLAAGDDVTDEDLFQALPESAFAIKIGSGPTAARHRLADPAELLDVLELLAA